MSFMNSNTVDDDRSHKTIEMFTNFDIGNMPMGRSIVRKKENDGSADENQLSWNDNKS